MRRLLIEDEDGNVKIELGVLRGKPGIYLKDNRGEDRISLQVTNEDCPLVYMSKAEGKAEIMMGINKGSSPVMSSKARDGTPYKYTTELR